MNQPMTNSQQRGAAAIINAADMAGNTHGTGKDRWDWSYYDSLVIPAIAGEDTFFTVIAGKTIAQTNMAIPAQIPKNERLKLFTIKPFYVSAVEHPTVDRIIFGQFLAGTVLEVFISPNKVLGQWTLMEILGLSVSFPVLGAATLWANFPDPKYNGLFPINREIELGESTVFRVNVHYTVAPAALAGDMLNLAFAGERYYTT